MAKQKKSKPPAVVESGADTIVNTKRLGRPSSYDEETGLEICTRIAAGESLAKICQDREMPAMSTVYKWMRENVQFADAYRIAREDQADLLAEQLIEIAKTEPDVQRARLMCDMRKWIASKLRPKRYGEKVEIEHNVGGDVGITTIRRVIVYPDARREVLAGGQAALPGPAESAIRGDYERGLKNGGLAYNCNRMQQHPARSNLRRSSFSCDFLVYSES